MGIHLGTSTLKQCGTEWGQLQAGAQSSGMSFISVFVNLGF